MKAYVQFFENGTGYVQGTIPPVFSKENIKPVELLGSDGVYILDGRNSIDTMIEDAFLRIDILKRVHEIIGFEIRKGDFSHYRVVYKNF